MTTRTAQPTRPESASEGASSDSERLPYGLLLARLGQESVRRFRGALAPLDLSPQQFMVLKQLQAIRTASQADLAQALGLDNSNLAAVTAELNDAGLIERYRHERDRRRYVIELSPSGAEALAEADEAIADGEQQLLSALQPADRERLWALLRDVADGAKLCPTSCAEAESQAQVEAQAEAPSAESIEVCTTDTY